MSFDGVWQVSTPQLCAGFVIMNNALVDVAPILRGRLFMMEGQIWYQGRSGATFPAQLIKE
jgi:hypothetical protein